MGMTMRVSLPGYDCLTDGTIDHYALYADQDNVLIKTNASGTVNLDYGQGGTINHGLGYTPMTLGWGQDINGNLIIARRTNAFSASNMWICYIGTARVEIYQAVDSGTKTFNYFIFYDKIV